ncbi:MAG TPA: hypothetical protein VFM25_15605 [Verrucomicrobiae bacterium]|jgi:hypothetical protein|nr:hypothetical protein [Verrucomicrobiae bacterium]
MARKLEPEEAEIFRETPNGTLIPPEADALMENLFEKENEPMELAIFPGLWQKGFAPDSFDS